MERMQKQHIIKDLDKKMVFIVGPRQAGKTWLAKEVAKSFKNSVYLNYDVIDDKEILKQRSWLSSTDLLIMDELHKMPDWKNYLKGVYDSKPSSMKILVTSSARLDVFDRLGDSLAGRYFRHRLLPLSLAEILQTNQKISSNRLLTHSGFPEPLGYDNFVDVKRWRQQYIESLLSTDIFEFDIIHNIKAMRLIFNLLRKKVGSPISYQSLAEDAAVSPTTVKKYIQILESLFIIFRISPYSKNIARSILKEPKVYFFDTGLVLSDERAKFENFVANCLLKHVYATVDCQAEEYSLHYLRTKDGEEIDFALIKNDRVELAIETKLSKVDISKSLMKFNKKYHFPSILLMQSLRNEQIKQDIKILNADKYLSSLYL